MSEVPYLVRETVLECIVRNHRVVAVTRGSLPPGNYKVEVEFMDKHRSYGVVKGKVAWNRLTLPDAQAVLDEMPNGTYTCVVYLGAEDAWTTQP